MIQFDNDGMAVRMDMVYVVSFANYIRRTSEHNHHDDDSPLIFTLRLNGLTADKKYIVPDTILTVGEGDDLVGRIIQTGECVDLNMLPLLKGNASPSIE
ncbi:MAG: hypothetical protein NUV82_01860 [Candidatus Komeilibacteria bacterium]|nr:hypothetical protein [Candidatus Komeilibacteria bacterium]